MVGGLLDDAELADSVIRDAGADLISVGARLRIDPGWPHQARARLAQREMFSD
jgi:2,4-dienoyl-CoA reductase-like NADH-dependent reductase (Old Yellow Enzyme family)